MNRKKKFLALLRGFTIVGASVVRLLLLLLVVATVMTTTMVATAVILGAAPESGC